MALKLLQLRGDFVQIRFELILLLLIGLVYFLIKFVYASLQLVPALTVELSLLIQIFLESFDSLLHLSFLRSVSILKYAVVGLKLNEDVVLLLKLVLIMFQLGISFTDPCIRN